MITWSHITCRFIIGVPHASLFSGHVADSAVEPQLNFETQH